MARHDSNGRHRLALTLDSAALHASLLIAALFIASCGSESSGGGLDAGTDSDGGDSDAAELDGSDVEAVLPEVAFDLPRNADYAFNPYLGIDTSRRHLYIGLAPDATAADVERLLGDAGAELGGTVPGARVAQLVLPEEADVDDLEAAYQRLLVDAAVEAVTFDIALQPSVVPPDIGADPDWTWSVPPEGSNWGLEMIRAPLAWSLNRRIAESGAPPTRVTLLDGGYFPHPDLAGTLTATTADLADGALRHNANHGTAVAGIIGAGFGNGLYVDGINPEVEIIGWNPPGSGGGPEDMALSFGQVLVGFLQSTDAVTRIISSSIGYGWEQRCFGPILDQHRCDPRAVGRVPDGSRCDDARVRRAIEGAGRLVADIIVFLNETQPILVVQAAGNESGPMLGPTQDRCQDVPTPSAGMGDFPTELADPISAAAHSAHRPDAQASDNIILASAMNLSGSLAGFSNAGDVAAPGADIRVLDYDGSMWRVTDDSGTSFAAPYIAGSAAFVVRADAALAQGSSTLTNAELIQLLTTAPYARETAPGVMTLDLFGAVAGLDELRPGRNPSVRLWLADLDDNTPDGFQRAVYADDGSILSSYDVDAEGDGHVDLRDFRRLRDTYVMSTWFTFLDGDDPLVNDNPKLDLNQNGDHTRPWTEYFFPRAALDSDGAVDDSVGTYLGLTDTLDVDVLAEVYETDAVQPWLASDLRGLLSSADIHIRAAAAIAELGADGVLVTLEGLPAAGATAPSGLSPIQDVEIGPAPDEVILTTPLIVEPVVHWRPICSGTPSDEEVVLPFADLGAGVDLIVTLDADDHPGCCPPDDEECSVRQPGLPPGVPEGAPEAWILTVEETETQTSSNDYLQSTTSFQWYLDGWSETVNSVDRTVFTNAEGSTTDETVSRTVTSFDLNSEMMSQNWTITRTRPDPANPGETITEPDSGSISWECGAGICLYSHSDYQDDVPTCMGTRFTGRPFVIYYDGRPSQATDELGTSSWSYDWLCDGCGGASLSGCTCERTSGAATCTE